MLQLVKKNIYIKRLVGKYLNCVGQMKTFQEKLQVLIDLLLKPALRADCYPVNRLP